MRRLTSSLILAMVGIAAAAGVAAWLGASAVTVAQVVTAAAIAVSAWIALTMSARARRLARLEDHARSLLTWSRLHREPALSRPPALESDDAEDREFGPLRQTLKDLAERIDEHLKELAKKTRNLEALIDALDEPVFATDNQENVLLCNRSAEAMFEARPGELIGRPIAGLFTQEEVLSMHAAARTGELRRSRVRLTTPLGPRVYQVSAAPVPVAWGEGVFGAVLMLRDVTELDLAVQVKSDFVANASHELRTPVSAIRVAADTLLDVGDDGAMRAKLARMILGHATGLEEMMRDLLDLSRMESPDVVPEVADVDIWELARSFRDMFAGACEDRRLELDFDLPQALAGLRTDPKLLRLILRNLIENAVKFAYEGTTVRITARRIPTPAGQPEPASGVGVRFEVVDQGVGVPLHLRDRVFERFFQVDPARTGTSAMPAPAQSASGRGRVPRGTGLGLSIVKHAVKALGGEVGLDSVYRQGTRAWVELPVSFAPTSTPTTETSTARVR